MFDKLVEDINRSWMPYGKVLIVEHLTALVKKIK